MSSLDSGTFHLTISGFWYNFHLNYLLISTDYFNLRPRDFYRYMEKVENLQII